MSDSTLSNQEILRYSRHLIMPEVAMDGRKKLKVVNALPAVLLCRGFDGNR